MGWLRPPVSPRPHISAAHLLLLRAALCHNTTSVIHRRRSRDCNNPVAYDHMPKLRRADGIAPFTFQPFGCHHLCQLLASMLTLPDWCVQRARPGCRDLHLPRPAEEHPGGDIRRRSHMRSRCAEGRKFLANVTGVDRDVTMVQAETGMRVEEVCQLDPKHVQAAKGVTWLKITDAKTKSGVRRVPVVAREVRAMLAERVASGKPLLFHELKVDRFGDRSKALVKRLGRRLRSLGFTDKALVADYSWRHRARTLLEHADIWPATADAFLGHRRPGEGLGRYSEGPSDAQLVEAAKAIRLPKAQ
jgi:hypothetical protein